MGEIYEAPELEISIFAAGTSGGTSTNWEGEIDPVLGGAS